MSLETSSFEIRIGTITINEVATRTNYNNIALLIFRLDNQRAIKNWLRAGSAIRGRKRCCKYFCANPLLEDLDPFFATP